MDFRDACPWWQFSAPGSWRSTAEWTGICCHGHGNMRSRRAAVGVQIKGRVAGCVCRLGFPGGSIRFGKIRAADFGLRRICDWYTLDVWSERHR